MNVIYLDNNATTRLAPEVLRVMTEAWTEGLVNPASQHMAGQRARRVLEGARCQILSGLGARLSGMSADRLILTSGGTEANNLAVLGLARPGSRVLVSAVEHPSVLAAAQQLRLGNIDVQRIPVDHQGVICLEQLRHLLASQPTSLVAVMAANNETGVLQPLTEIVALAHEHGARVHCDAVQWVGKLPLSFADWEIDSLAVSPHKFHGPVGVAGLCLRSGLQLKPMVFGGFQEDGLRPGTVPVPLVVGFARALELCSPPPTAPLTELRQRLERSLSKVLPIVVHGQQAARAPHTSNLSLPGVDRQAFLLAADQRGLCLSTGSACSSGSSEPSPVLMAMGLSAEEIASSLRFSVSRYTTPDEIDRAVEIIVQIVASCRVDGLRT